MPLLNTSPATGGSCMLGNEYRINFTPMKKISRKIFQNRNFSAALKMIQFSAKSISKEIKKLSDNNYITNPMRS